MILAIDTTTLQSSAALIDGDGAIVASRRATVTTHSEQLVGLVQAVLADAGIAPGRLEALEAIACGAGPGSFTGLRIGLSTAKGLCLALERPLVLVSSLTSLALRAPAGTIAVATIDAFKGEVYAATYRREADGAAPLTRIGDEEVLAPERLAARIAEDIAKNPSQRHRLLGNAVEHWPALLVPGVDASDRAPPDAREVAVLARLRFFAGERDDLASAVPRYVRASEAEIKFGRSDS